MNTEDKILGLIAQAEDIQRHAVALQRDTQDALKTLPEATRGVIRDAARDFIVQGAETASRGLLEASSMANEAAKRLSAVWLKQGIFLVALALVLMAGFYFGSKFLLSRTMDNLVAAREEVAELQKTVDKLVSKGGKVQLSTCGDRHRLCFRVDQEAGNFGNKQEQYMILYGY